MTFVAKNNYIVYKPTVGYAIVEAGLLRGYIVISQLAWQLYFTFWRGSFSIKLAQLELTHCNVLG